MKRDSFIYLFKATQLIITAIIALSVFLRTEMKYGGLEDASRFWGALFFSLYVMFNGMFELAMTVFRLLVFFKQRDSLFYPAWAFGLPICLTRIPVSVLESLMWIILTYYTIGFAPCGVLFLWLILLVMVNDGNGEHSQVELLGLHTEQTVSTRPDRRVRNGTPTI